MVGMKNIDNGREILTNSRSGKENSVVIRGENGAVYLSVRNTIRDEKSGANHYYSVTE